MTVLLQLWRQVQNLHLRFTIHVSSYDKYIYSDLKAQFIRFIQYKASTNYISWDLIDVGAPFSRI